MDVTEKQLERHRRNCERALAGEPCQECTRLIVTLGRKLAAHPPETMRKEPTMPPEKLFYFIGILYVQSMEQNAGIANLQQQLGALNEENIELKKKYAPELLPPEAKEAAAKNGRVGSDTVRPTGAEHAGKITELPPRKASATHAD